MENIFPLDHDILGPNSALSLQLTASTDPDVLEAVALNRPFPAGPINLNKIALTASGKDPALFQSSQLTVALNFSAGITAAAAIFDAPDGVLDALNLGETPNLPLAFTSTPVDRYLLLSSGYQASASVKGSHPIGALGSLTFGATAAASGLSAVVQRFPATTRARDLLAGAIKSWKLPIHINAATKLEPATWLITEATGSLAIKLGASLGYNFDFIRQTKAAGLSGDVGMKMDAAINATFGIDVSGRYLVIVGRESSDPADHHIRLSLFKLNCEGLQFGLNLKVGVTGVESLVPDAIDDFIKAVFGVHGTQIVTLLGQMEKWTDSKKSVGEIIAGLANDKALDLLKTATGIDPATAFDTARAVLIDAVQTFHKLPPKVSSEFLSILGKLTPPGLEALQKALAPLASTDPQVQTQALKDLLSTPGVTRTPIGRLISSLADHGLLHLLDQLPKVRTAASLMLTVMHGKVIANVQAYVETNLDLNNIMKAHQHSDFKELDSFLTGRLAHFFDKTLDFDDLDEVKNAIHLVVSKRNDICNKAHSALNSRYGCDVASTWQRTTSDTAVLDVTFDLADPTASEMFQAVIGRTNDAFDRLITTELPAVQINYGVLSHELTRKTTLDVSLPEFNSHTDTITNALAKVTVEDDNGRLLVYDATGSSTVCARNKFNSSLNVTVAALATRPGAPSLPNLRIHGDAKSTWIYRLDYAKAKMKRKELEAITRPFLSKYMAAQFPTAASLRTLYDGLESTAEALEHNGPEMFGDVCASFEVTLPGEALSAWTLPVPDTAAATRQVSVAIQRALKADLLFFYLSDIAKLANIAASAPLLAWAAIPPAVMFDGQTFLDNAGKKPFWDHVNPDLRHAAALHHSTAENLSATLPQLRQRLDEAGLTKMIQFYLPDQLGTILRAAINQTGDPHFSSLLFFEACIVEKAGDAIQDIQKFLPLAATQPTAAKNRLAQFAFDITDAFGRLIGNSAFANLATFRGIAQTVFGEASRALNPALDITPRAMLTLEFLHPAPACTFAIPDYFTGKHPAPTDIAIEQRLVSL